MIIVKNPHFQISIHHIDILTPIEDLGKEFAFHLDFNSYICVAFCGERNKLLSIYNLLSKAQFEGEYNFHDEEKSPIRYSISEEISLRFCKK